MGPLARGGILPADGLVLVTEEEIFGARAHRRKESGASRTDPFGRIAEDLRSSLAGRLCRSRRARHRAPTKGSCTRPFRRPATVDLITIEYGGGDKLYLPVWRLNQLRQGDCRRRNVMRQLKPRQVGRQHVLTDQGARRSRGAQDGRRASSPLCGAASHAWTPARAGRTTSIARSSQASRSTRPRTRRARSRTSIGTSGVGPSDGQALACGDVGFGKTEVALRAAFRAAMAGRQVALLLPNDGAHAAALSDFRVADRRLSVDDQGAFSLSDKEGAGGDAHRSQGRQGRRGGGDASSALEGRLFSKNLGLLVVDVGAALWGLA